MNKTSGIFLLVLTILAFHTHAQLNFEQYSYLKLCNKSDDTINVELELISPFYNEVSSLSSVTEKSMCLDTLYPGVIITKNLLKINSESRLIHLIPSDTLFLNYLGPENWDFPNLNSAYDDYSKNLAKGLNRLSSKYLNKYADSLPDKILKHEKTFLLFDSLELRLRELSLDEVNPFRDSVNALYNLNDESLVTSPGYLFFLDSYYSSMYDQHMNDTVPGYYQMSHFGKEMTRKEYYQNKFKKSLLNSNTVGEKDVSEVNFISNGNAITLEDYLQSAEINRLTYGLQHAKNNLDPNLFDALVFSFGRAMISHRTGDAKLIFNYIDDNLSNEALKSILMEMYRKQLELLGIKE